MRVRSRRALCDTDAVRVGGMSQRQAQAVVDGYQVGETQVLIASITAAAVDLTVTRGNHAVFLESDWTPALVPQAMDRQHRHGQTRNVIARTLVGLGTLDEHVQRLLDEKGHTASTIVGDDIDLVSVVEKHGLLTPKDLVEELVEAAIALLKRR